MLHALLELTASPGPFVPPPVDALADVLLFLALLTSFFSLIVWVTFGFGIGSRRTRILVALAFTVVAVLLWVGFVLRDAAVESPGDAYQAYTQSAIEWIDTEYGITLDDDAFTQLRDGDELVVTFDGQDTLITFANRPDGTFLLRSPGGELLSPVTD